MGAGEIHTGKVCSRLLLPSPLLSAVFALDLSISSGVGELSTDTLMAATVRERSGTVLPLVRGEGGWGGWTCLMGAPLSPVESCQHGLLITTVFPFCSQRLLRTTKSLWQVYRIHVTHTHTHRQYDADQGEVVRSHSPSWSHVERLIHQHHPISEESTGSAESRTDQKKPRHMSCQ